MAFVEFFSKQKDSETSASINKSSSEQSVFHNYPINKNVAKIFNSNQESEDAGTVIQNKKRNSKSEENIFDKFDFPGTSSAGSTLSRKKTQCNEYEDNEKVEVFIGFHL